MGEKCHRVVHGSSCHILSCLICVVLTPLFQSDVMDLVELMGGRVYRDLNVSVTHLVAGEVGSKKYLVAASLGKPVLLPSWVKACWDRCQERWV